MTTIAQLDPISVSFNIAESALPQLFAAKSQQQLKVRASLVEAAAADELLGQLSFIDNAVDSRSGTIRIKAQFDNRAGKLWPGMYVHLRLQAGVQKQALLLPVGAVQNGPDGKFAFVLGADNRLQAQPLTLLAIRNEQAIVNGLPAGSVVVAGSGVNLRPGDQIKPKFAADKAGAKP
jgi:RND family efflux transporter MFP subunit